MHVRIIVPLLAALVMTLPHNASCAPADSSAGSPWGGSIAGYYYAFPHETDVVMAVARANHKSFHLEARYNYEDRRTASAFAGWNLTWGDAFTVDLTPMAGAAFGNSKGIIPALEMSLGYNAFDFYAEAEYLVDPADAANNFAYTWLELGISPIDPLRAGFVAQRTRIFESPLELDRGLFAQMKQGAGTASLYAFNLFTDSWFVVIGIEIGW